MRSNRAEFSPNVRTILAQRAAYRCSNPSCRALTVGPGPSSRDVVRTGIASHIWAAADNGPRGIGDQDYEERRQIENGIWLCGSCGLLVDAARGKGYSPPLLRSWKDLHEARVRIEQGGYSTPIGWVTSLEFLDDPVMLTPVEIRFARKNIVCGNNGSGKSTILRLLQSLTGSRHVTARASYGRKVCVRVNWFDPHPRSALLTADSGNLTNEVDGKRVPYVPRPYRVIACGEEGRSGELNDIEWLASSFDVDPWVLRELLKLLPTIEGVTISEVVARGNDILVRTKSEPELTSLRGRFGWERIELFLGTAILLANTQADVEPTVLVMDGPFAHLHPSAQRDAFALFDSARHTFQVVFSAVEPPRYLGPDWLITYCHRSGQATRITQIAGDYSNLDDAEMDPDQ